MSDPVPRLNAALEGRYSIERELGAGGMATVYLAEDVRHHRKVAVKVLRPDLAAMLGPERFLREIEIAAALTHPHIVPLHDSGEADGFLFYVLPYIEGESLRDRLVREGELPVGEVVRILRDVVDALAHAHDHGLVHRDIKPDNVMLSGRHALVMDFGVAKAVSQATELHQLTTVGVALGTPAYMAPEQAEASDHIDHRADIYAVGALAYELLAGQPPFTGRSSQIVLLAHATRTPEAVTEHRSAVPPALAHLVMHCLEKKPADRWQSAEEMLGHLEALATPSGGLTPSATVPVKAAAGGRGVFTPMKISAAAALVLVVASAVSLLRSGGGSGASESQTAELDDNIVAVVPFQFSGPDELAYLGEGIMHLIAPRFGGDVGPRAVDPGSSGAIWQDLSSRDPVLVNERVAQALGAGLVLTGSVVAVGQGLRMNASLRRVIDGTEVAAAEAEGPADSVTAVVDRLAAGLLSLSAGEYEQSLDQLTSTSPEALREYLLGQRESRRSEFNAAVEHFRRAVQIDSTFALAAIAWADAGNNALGADVPAALALASRHRDGLSARDLVYLRARLGPNYPDGHTSAELIRGYEEGLGVQPDRAFLWYFLGETSFHDGYGREEGWLDRVRGYFQRALDLDPQFGAAMTHLLFTDYLRGDVHDIRESAARLVAVDSTSLGAAWGRTILALTDPDTTGFRQAYSAFLEGGGWGFTFTYATRYPAVAGEAWMVEESERGIAASLGSVATGSANLANHRMAYQSYLSFGRPRRANEILSRYERATGDVQFNMRLMDAAYGALPEEFGLVAAQMQEEQLRGKTAADLTLDEVRSLVRLSLWRLSRGDGSHSAETVEMLRAAAAGASRVDSMAFRATALFLEADLAEREGDPEAGAILERMREGYDQGLTLGRSADAGLHFAMADLYERLGDPAAAFGMLEREFVISRNEPNLAEYMRERGRLAALLGDTARAIREYGHYLLLRHDPEREVEQEVEEVRPVSAPTASYVYSRC